MLNHRQEVITGKTRSVFALFKLAAGLCGHAHELDACMGEDGGGVAFRSRLFYF